MFVNTNYSFHIINFVVLEVKFVHFNKHTSLNKMSNSKYKSKQSIFVISDFGTISPLNINLP